MRLVFVRVAYTLHQDISIKIIVMNVKKSQLGVSIVPRWFLGRIWMSILIIVGVGHFIVKIVSKILS